VATTEGMSIEQPSRLELLHAAVFTLGFTLAVAGVVSVRPHLLMISGPCLVFSAYLTWLGLHARFSGTVGHMLRAALGPMRLLSLHMRTLTWLVVGIALTLWGVSRLARPGLEEGLPPHEPVSGVCCHV
jgi:hypothetical protein